MSKLPSNLRVEEVANILKKLGYQMVNSTGSHFVFVNKQGRIVTLVRRSPVPRSTLEWVIDQVKISREEFLDLL